MDLRERLIDFSKWWEYYGKRFMCEENIDEYLKSINCALDEAQAVRQNKAQEKPCNCGWSCREQYNNNSTKVKYICALGKKGD